MARYRKIDPRMWGDAKFRSLSRATPNAQTLWIYLLTGPHTQSAPPGLYHLGEMTICEALGWPLKGFRERFRELFQKGLAKADWEARVVLIPRVLKYDPPDNPNVLKYWAKLFDAIPECSLKNEYFSILKGFVERLSKPFQESCLNRFGNGMPIPEPEPEPEPEPKEEGGVGETKTTLPERASTKNDFLSKLKQNLAYSHIDINNELRKMDAWLSLPKNKGRKKTGKFILNWLNKIEKPMEVKPKIEGDYPRAEDQLRKQGFGDDYFGIGKSWKNKD